MVRLPPFPKHLCLGFLLKAPITVWLGQVRADLLPPTGDNVARPQHVQNARVSLPSLLMQ